MFRAEFRKVKRSALWLIAIVIPLCAACIGAYTYQQELGAKAPDWDGLVQAIMDVHGAYIYPLGIALIAAFMWMDERRGASWTMMRTSTRHTYSMVIAKMAVLALVMAYMQGVTIMAILGVGTFYFRLPGVMPLAGGLLLLVGVFTGLPLMIFQSLLSSTTRSQITPFVVCLIGCALGLWIESFAPTHLIRLFIPQGLIGATLHYVPELSSHSLGSVMVGFAPQLGIGLVMSVLFLIAHSLAYSVNGLGPNR